MQRRSWHRSALEAALLASLLLGSVDALVACWANRAVAPHATLPLCLTAPFGVALLLLAPLAGAAALVLRLLATALALRLLAARREVRSVEPPDERRVIVAVLVAAIAGAAALPAVGALVEAWRGAGAGDLAAAARVAVLPAALGAAWAALRFTRALLDRVSATRLRRVAIVAAMVQVAAFGGAVYQLRREGRGVLRGALLGSLAAAARTEPAPTAARSAPAVAAGGRPRAAAGRGGASAAPPVRNLVLLTIDTLRADHLDATRMPETTAFAARAVRFRAAFAASPWTLPALASLLTGLPPPRHGAGVPTGDDPLARSPLAPGVPTLATRLRAAGFATQAIVTNPYLALGYGLGRGFAGFENVTLEAEAVLTLRPTLGFRMLSRAVPALAIVDRGGAVTRRAARYLATRPPGGRFFLWLHYVDPHAPYDGATRSFRDDLLAGLRAPGSLPRMAQLRAGEIRPGPGGRRALSDAYARAVREVDREVGEVLSLLVRRGLGAETLVAIAADHGEELWDHGGVEHGHTLYDELIRVPLVIGCPGPRPGSGCPTAADVAVAVGIDGLAATLLDLLGVEAGAEGARAMPPVAGRAPGGAAASRSATAAMSPGFAALLRGGAWTPRPVLSANLLFAEERIALRTERFTYVAWPNGKEELYDRRRDPRELHDLAARRRLVQRHREALAGVVGTRFPEEPSGGRTGRPAGTGSAARGGAPPVVRRALQSLGYVE